MAVTYRVPGAVLTEREHRVPLDHAASDGPSITVFTREVAAPDGGDRPRLERASRLLHEDARSLRYRCPGGRARVDAIEGPRHPRPRERRRAAS